MVGNVTIQGQIVGTATFDGAKISAVVTIAPPINATVVFGKSGVSVHNELTGRETNDAHPIEAISDPVSNSSNIYGWIRGTLLTGLASFTDVAIVATDSVLQAFAKLQGQVNAVKVRLGLLEDSYLLKYIVPADVVSINLTTDKYGRAFNFVDGDKIEIIIQVKRFSGDLANRVNMRVNNFNGPYAMLSVGNADSIFMAGTSYYSNYASVIINILGGEIQGFMYNESKRTSTTYGSDFYSYYTVGLSAPSITSFNFYLNNQIAAIPAGTIILIRKIK